MDSKVVSKRIRSDIWPLMKQAGFEVFSSRNAWRIGAERIDVLNFQSFNAYLAESVGCTPFSFAINLGCYYTFIPESSPGSRLKSKNGRLMPHEYQCHLRGKLRKTLCQSLEKPSGLATLLPEHFRKTVFRKAERPDIWYVDADGHNLDAVMADAQAVVIQGALSWFERLSGLETVLDCLLNGHESEELWGMGAAGSPQRNYLTGYTALRLAQNDTALTCLHAVLASGVFQGASERLRRDIATLTGEG